MADPACDCCHGTAAPRIRLDQEAGSQSLTICLRCLRSSMLMKAASSEQRGSRLLRQYAEEYGLHLWRSGHAVYLLPAIAPFEQGIAARPTVAL
jgi:hypothetical protein